MHIKDLADYLRQWRISYTTETIMQESVEEALHGLMIDGIPVVVNREHRFNETDRVDFFLPEDGLAIECKIRGNFAAVMHQLIRYAGQESVKGVILVTSKSTHIVHRDTLCCKDFETVHVVKAF